MGTYTWGQPFNTNGYNGYWPNPGVKTDGIGMPSFRMDRDGERPFYIGDIRPGYASGPTSIWDGIYYAPPGYGQVQTEGNYVFPHSGGSFSYYVRGSAGTLRFGRDETQGRTVQSENQAYAWGGTLAGAFDWAEVPESPSITPYLDGRTFKFSDWWVSDDGDTPVNALAREMSVNGGAYHAYTLGWGDWVEGTPGNTYTFRFSARNAVGWSLWAAAAPITVPYSGGRRMTGSSSSVPLTFRRRFNGDTWVDLTTGKRNNGSTFVEITN